MNEAQILDTPEQIEMFRMAALRGAVKLEVLGMRRRGRPATVIARELLGLPRGTSKAKVLAALEAALEA
jgi:hypothetical protein